MKTPKMSEEAKKRKELKTPPKTRDRREKEKELKEMKEEGLKPKKANKQTRRKKG